MLKAQEGKETDGMIKYLGKKIMAIGLSLVLCCTGCNKEYLSSSDSRDSLLTSSMDKRMKKASKEPFGRYPETITYTLGKISNSDNAGMPEGDTFEDNAYTRYLKQQLNIQNEDVFSGSGSDYKSMVIMAITSGEIPDIMVLEDYEYLKILVEKDMIEDLTPYYEQCASDRIKEIYSSYGSDYFNEVTFDGKMMAFPETLIDSGPNVLWLRYDWLEELNLEEPKTIKDVENIAKQFKEHDMSGTGETIGLPMTTDISSDYIASMSILFASKGSYLRSWIKKDGSYQYGSVQPEAKEGLKELRRLYKEGTLDNQFLFRADNNIEELIKDGKCGIFFGEWWSGDNPLMQARSKNKDADWRPYLIETDSDGKTSYVQQNPVGKYVVVRKGFEYPEIVIKMHNVLFNKLQQDDSQLNEIAQYYKRNVDPTARPCSINVDYENALERSYENIQGALTGEVDPQSLELMNYSYYKACKRYMEKGKEASDADWAAYITRIVACSLLQEDKVKKVDTYYLGENTKTMEKEWESLMALEKETYLSIITGEKPLFYFDTFVKQWKANGGEQITKEVNQTYQEKHSFSL